MFLRHHRFRLAERFEREGVGRRAASEIDAGFVSAYDDITAQLNALLERAQRAEDAAGELEKLFEALSATAELDQVIFDGASFGTGAASGTPEEMEYLGLPGLLTADQVAVLLNKRQAEQLAARKRQKAPEPREPVAEPRLSAGTLLDLRRTSGTRKHPRSGRRTNSARF